jgi:hypothetical protein
MLRDHLVTEAERETSAFWGTALGRAIALQGYAPIDDRTEQVGASIVGAILGMSRQRVHELQKKGRLCTPEQVADELEKREATA